VRERASVEPVRGKATSLWVDKIVHSSINLKNKSFNKFYYTQDLKMNENIFSFLLV
jgi:hypothetical protein